MQIKRSFFLLSLALVVISLNAFAAEGDPIVKTIRISKKQLKRIPVNQLVEANANSSVNYCRISFNNEFNQTIQYGIIDEQEPKSLRGFLSSLKPGQTVTIQNRYTLVNGEKKPLADIVYQVVK